MDDTARLVPETDGEGRTRKNFKCVHTMAIVFYGAALVLCFFTAVCASSPWSVFYDSTFTITTPGISEDAAGNQFEYTKSVGRIHWIWVLVLAFVPGVIMYSLTLDIYDPTQDEGKLRFRKWFANHIRVATWIEISLGGTFFYALALNVAFVRDFWNLVLASCFWALAEFLLLAQDVVNSWPKPNMLPLVANVILKLPLWLFLIAQNLTNTTYSTTYTYLVVYGSILFDLLILVVSVVDAVAMQNPIIDDKSKTQKYRQKWCTCFGDGSEESLLSTGLLVLLSFVKEAFVAGLMIVAAQNKSLVEIYVP